MGALTVNRKRGFDYFTPNSIHSSSSLLQNNYNYNNNNNSHSSKKPKISPFTTHQFQIQIPSQKPKSRYYSYPEPVNQFKREVHAPCRGFTKFASRGNTTLNNDFNYYNNHSSRVVVERGINSHSYSNGNYEMGNVFGSQHEMAKRVSIRSPLFNNGKEDQVIDVDDFEIGDIEFFDDLDQMETDKIAEIGMEIEKGGLGTESDDKDAISKLENNMENDKMSWDLESYNKKMSLLGRPVYKQLWEEAERNNLNLSRLDFDIKLTEKQLKQFHLLRPVKRPAEEVVPEDVLREAFVPLTEEEKAEVSRAFSDSNRRKVLATHDNSNIAITGEILRCLRPTEWLNDEVINVYMELLKERERRDPKKYLKCHFFNTFFYKKLCGGENKYEYKSVRRWTTQRKLGYTLKDCDKIFVPIHRPYHWCLAVINKKENKFQYLDSLGGTDSKVLKALARYFVEEVKDKSGENIDVSSWKQENITDLPAQKNGFDCGMFMVKYTDFYSRGLGLYFKQDNMPYFRLRTAKEILRLRAE